MVSFANEVRKLFMGDADSYENTIEVTLSTRTLIRWADLALKFQPLANQGIEPLSYALDRALTFKATRSTRVMLHELVHRIFAVTFSSERGKYEYHHSFRHQDSRQPSGPEPQHQRMVRPKEDVS